MPAYCVWGAGHPGSQSENPLCASHYGIDGYTGSGYYSGRGHVDDYWTDVNSNGVHPQPDYDPFTFPNPDLIPHPDNCVADFLGTSQYPNTDGGTDRALIYIGMRTFFEYRGYGVAQSYFQRTTDFKRP